jgi:hypothetical protein
MTVYVDDVRYPYGRMVMCHMFADTLEELHAMADAIGIQRKWFQQPPKASWHHYDISLGKKDLAIAKGAVLTDRYGSSYFVAKQRGDTAMVERIEALRARRERIATVGA